MQTSYWNGQYKDFLCTWLVIICKKNCDHNSVRSKGLGYIDEKFDSYRKVYELNVSKLLEMIKRSTKYDFL